MLKLAVADQRWIGRRVIVAASGPSLMAETALVCSGETILAVSDAVRVFPDAEIVYSCDAVWWEVNGYLKEFGGERWTSHSLRPKNDKREMPNKELFHIIGGSAERGFSNDPKVIHYGNNSGFQAVNLAILFGAAEIVLIGFDMRMAGNRSHFFGNHKIPLRDTHSFVIWINEFAHASKTLSSKVRIINATPNSALRCFPMMPLEEVLNPVLEAAE